MIIQLPKYEEYCFVVVSTSLDLSADAEVYLTLSTDANDRGICESSPVARCARLSITDDRELTAEQLIRSSEFF
jgi:hypothetical protein